MGKRYGLPYKGSKSKIADWVLSNIPSSLNFYDLFCGGCAITHAALLSGKYKHVIANDIQPTAKLFMDACQGKFKDEKRWISREDFHRLKHTEPYVKYVWSFGNNGKDYIYGQNIEPYKRALHYAIVFKDVQPFSELGLDFPANILDIPTIHERRIAAYRWVRSVRERCDLQSLKRLQSLERLERLESLERLERLESLERLERLERSYDEIEIKPNSIVYCDIPYKGTGGYGIPFSYDKFYDWVRTQTMPIYISEYNMPDDFVCIAQKGKLSTFSATTNSTKTIEKIFVYKNFAEWHKAKMDGLSLFDK